MPQAFQQFGDINQSGIGALSLNGHYFLIQLISFILVFLILKKFAFKPILKIMAERKKLIEDGVATGEQMKKEKALLEEEIATSLHEAREKADSVINSAQQEARELVQKAEQTAKEKVEQISADAQEKIKRDTALARKQLETELVGLISEATEAIIDEKVDSKKDAELIDKVLRQGSSS